MVIAYICIIIKYFDSYDNKIISIAMRVPVSSADIAANGRAAPPTPTWRPLTAVDGTLNILY